VFPESTVQRDEGVGGATVSGALVAGAAVVCEPVAGAPVVGEPVDGGTSWARAVPATHIVSTALQQIALRIEGRTASFLSR